MNAPPSRRNFFRLSLRELLLIFGFLAVGCAALRNPSPRWAMILLSSIAVFFMTAAMVDRGRIQALSGGFAVWTAAYAALAYLSPEKLPTTQLLRPMHEAAVTRTYIDLTTGQVIPNFDPMAPSAAKVIYGSQESFDFMRFAEIGHLLWTLLFGYLGGRFAGWVYDRRTHREASQVATAR